MESAAGGFRLVPDSSESRTERPLDMIKSFRWPRSDALQSGSHRLPIAVIIDTIFDVRRGQKLRLADLARIGANQVAQRKIAALDDLQRGEKLALEQFAAAAIVRQGGDRANDGQLAHVAGAVVAFERPDRHEERRRHAELALDAREQGGMALHQPSGAVDAGRNDAGRGVILEALAKRAALAPIEGKHRSVWRQTRKRAVDHRPRYAGGRGFARYGGQESVEVTAARRRPRRRREKQGAKQDGERS